MAIIGAAIVGCAIAFRFHKKIEETVAPAAIILMLIMYISGRWFGLTPGFILVLVLIGVCLIYSIYILIKDRSGLRSSLITWGGLAFVVYLLFFAFYAFHRDFSHPDELYCWGLLAREYYTYRNMFSPLATSLAGDATPLMPLWNGLNNMMWFGFSDSICYLAQNTFVISLMLPVFSHVKKKDMGIVDFGLLMLILPLILVVSGMEGFGFIICDMLLAAELCFFMISGLSFIQSRDYYYYFSMMASVMAMCLTKRTGVLFAAVSVFMVTGIMMNADYKHFGELLGLVIASTLTVFTWFGIEDYTFIPIAFFITALVMNITVRWCNDLSDHFRPYITGILIFIALAGLGGFVFIFLARSGYGYDVMARFMRDLFRISLGDEEPSGYICLSYGFFMTASMIAALIIKERNSMQWFSESSDIFVKLFAHISIGMLLYALVMLYAHIKNIGPVNEYRESIIPRYIIPMEIVVVFMIVYVFVVENQQTSSLIIMISLVAILMISDSGSFFRDVFARHQCIGFTAFDDAGITLASGDMVYFIDEQPYFGYSDREFYNHIAPAKSNFIDQIFFGNNGRIEMTQEELSQDMADDRYLHVPYDYLYLQSFDEDFIERYGGLFENVGDIAPGSVYRIIPTGDQVQLQVIR